MGNTKKAQSRDFPWLLNSDESPDGDQVSFSEYKYECKFNEFPPINLFFPISLRIIYIKFTSLLK